MHPPLSIRCGAYASPFFSPVIVSLLVDWPKVTDMSLTHRILTMLFPRCLQFEDSVHVGRGEPVPRTWPMDTRHRSGSGCGYELHR